MPNGKLILSVEMFRFINTLLGAFIFWKICLVSSKENDTFTDFQSFKLEILETTAFSATFRFQNVKLERTTSFYYYYCVQVSALG